MCRKVQPSIFISKRKCLISTKCYTKDSFRFTSFCFLRVLCFHCCPIPIQLSEIPPACFTSPPTPRYACSQILLLVHFLQQTSSHCPPSFTHTHTAQKTLQKQPGYFADIWQPAQKWCACLEENCRRFKSAWHWGTLGRWCLLAVMKATLEVGSAGTGDPTALLSPLLTSHERSSEQAKEDASQGTLLLQSVVASAGNWWGRQSWWPPGFG